MKKFLLTAMLFMALASCNNEGKTNAAANDSTPHPNGMTDASAISTDTAAMRMDTTHSINK